MELNKAQKMVEIVHLMSRKVGVRADTIRDRYDLDNRTFRRYVADIKSMGLPIMDEGRGEERVLSLEARWCRTGVQLSLCEVLSLHFGRTLFNFLDGTQFAEDIDDAIERLEPAISRADHELAKQLDTKFLAVSEHAKDYRGAGSDLIDDVVSALVYNNPMSARYSRLGGVPRTYKLHPYTLATYRQGLYLLAYDVEAAIVKTFALERFTDLRRLRKEYFEIPRGWSPSAYLADSFGIIGGTPQRIVLAFDPSVSAYIKERVWHPTQTLRTLPDGRLELRLNVGLSIELKTWIMGFGRSVEVLGPSSLVDDIVADLTAAVGRYA